QAGRRGDRREHPQDPQARALQGQGDPVRGRVRSQEGREGRQGGREVTQPQGNRVARIRRHKRVRKRISGTGARPRLAVYRSNRHIYAQLIDDLSARTVAAASDAQAKAGGDKSEQAKAVGRLIAEEAKKIGIERVVLDRGGRLYHGRVAALADGAREGGLQI